jgi:hypothetical protein
MFNIEAALDGMAELIRTVPAMESVQIGAPESLSHRIAAWVTVGDPGEIGPRETGIYELPVNLIVWFGYAIGGAEGAAEAQLADYISNLTMHVIQNRMNTVTGNTVTVTPFLNGSVARMELPQAAAGVADYTLMAGEEARTYPLGIRVVQRWNAGV